MLSTTPGPWERGGGGIFRVKMGCGEHSDRGKKTRGTGRECNDYLDGGLTADILFLLLLLG